MPGIVVSVFNAAGGVGKTTLTHHLGRKLAESKRVLLVDWDPQATLTAFTGFDPNVVNVSVIDTLTSDTTNDFPILPVREGLDLVPTRRNELASLEQQLSGEFLKDLRLRQRLEKVLDAYDFVIIDCPSFPGFLTLLALASSKYLVVPVQTEFKALESINTLLPFVGKIRSQVNRQLEILTIVPTMYNRQRNVDQDVLQALNEQLKSLAPVSECVPNAVAFTYASASGLTLFDYEPNHKAVAPLNELAARVEATGKNASEVTV